ncbi:MAG: type III pantothenate kinase [Chryseolinea sp.]
MLLAIDIGNSDITLGISNGDGWNPVWRIPTVADRPQMYYSMRIINNFLESGLKHEQVEQVVISSVVPELTKNFAEVAAALFERSPLVLGPDLYKNLPLTIRNPYEIGADLVANALAAHSRFRQNCVVVDFGAALTFTTISHSGEILGVSIAPGLKTAIRALSQNTARLFDVPLEMPSTVLGKGTTQAVQAGVLIGYEGMVMHMLKRIKEELNDHDVKTIATGGLCRIIPTLGEVFTEIDPYLTLTGLRIVAEGSGEV